MCPKRNEQGGKAGQTRQACLQRHRASPQSASKPTCGRSGGATGWGSGGRSGGGGWGTAVRSAVAGSGRGSCAAAAGYGYGCGCGYGLRAHHRRNVRQNVLATRW